MGQDVQVIEPLDDDQIPQASGAAPGVGLGDVLRYLPVALAFIQGLLSGAAEIPAFRTRVMGQMKEIGPCPIRNV